MKWSIPEKIIERGRQYLRSGRVLSVTPDHLQKVWHAEVLGTERYYVSLDGTAKENDICQCPYWQEHHYCKHTVAVELYLRQENKARVMKDAPGEVLSVSQSKMFTKGFSGIAQAGAAQAVVPLAVEFHIEVLETNPYHPELALLGIQLKIGYLAQKSRLYIVKNIYEFLQAWQDEKSYSLNKQTFVLQPAAFDEKTGSLLQQLSGIAQSQQLAGARGLQVNGKLDKRSLLLPVALGKELLIAMNDLRGLRLKIGEQVWPMVEMVENARPLRFEVVKTGIHYQLLIQYKFASYFSHYHWGFAEGKFYQFTGRQQEIYLTLQQLLKRVKGSAVMYQQEELPELFKLVLPLLREIGEVTVAPAILEEISETPLQNRLVFRKKNQQITVTTVAVYGDSLFSSDPSQSVLPEDGKIILRDLQQEEQLRQVLLDFGFRATATGFDRPLPKGSALYAFFTKEIPYFRRFGEVQMGKKLRSLFLDAQQYQPQIAISEKDSWLDVRFDVSGIAETEIAEVLQSLLDQQAFHTLANGQILALDTELFQEANQFLQQIRQDAKIQQDSLQLPKYRSLLLQEAGGELAVQSSTDFQRLTADLLHPEQFQTELPKGLQAELREYQKQGFRWLKMLSHHHFGGILADEMGLGKTLQAITYLLSEQQEKGRLKALIVAPASLTYNWLAELKKFAPALTAVVVSGSKEERSRTLQEEAEILITSYTSLRQDSEEYQTLNLEYLILDEAQMVKNSATKTAQALRGLPIPHCFALSGTPIENNLEELWSLFQIIMPGFFPGKTKFRQLTTALIAQMIQPFVLRRDKQTVLQDLPEKIEANVYSALTEEQKKVYLAHLRQMQEQVTQMDQAAFKKNRISILAGLTRLRQICCDPRLFIEDYQGGSGKLEQVKELVLTAKESGHKILLFSQFTSMLSLIETELHRLDISTFYLRGSTKPQDRLTMVNAFNEGAKDVFLISLKAGGTGLNLTGADTVILYDLWWNPAVEEQAAGRAHRIGQKNVVEVWRMIAEGTIEERMDLLQKEKRELFQQVIQGDQEQLQQLTEEDIRMILSLGEES